MCRVVMDMTAEEFQAKEVFCTKPKCQCPLYCCQRIASPGPLSTTRCSERCYDDDSRRRTFDAGTASCAAEPCPCFSHPATRSIVSRGSYVRGVLGDAVKHGCAFFDDSFTAKNTLCLVRHKSSEDLRGMLCNEPFDDDASAASPAASVAAVSPAACKCDNRCCNGRCSVYRSTAVCKQEGMSVASNKRPWTAFVSTAVVPTPTSAAAAVVAPTDANAFRKTSNHGVCRWPGEYNSIIVPPPNRTVYDTIDSEINLLPLRRQPSNSFSWGQKCCDMRDGSALFLNSKVHSTDELKTGSGGVECATDELSRAWLAGSASGSGSGAVHSNGLGDQPSASFPSVSLGASLDSSNTKLCSSPNAGDGYAVGARSWTWVASQKLLRVLPSTLRPHYPRGDVSQKNRDS